MAHWVLRNLFLFLLILMINSHSLASTNQAADIILVTNNQDSGPGSFREALEMARSGTVIRFSKDVFPKDSPATIEVLSNLPPLDDGHVTIDASDTGVILDGGLIARHVDSPGLGISSDYNRVMGLEVRNFTAMGILIVDGGQYNIVGGRRNGEGNVVGGNRGGINIVGEDSAYNQIIGNLVGTDSSGTVSFGNLCDGMWIGEGAHHNLIGGSKQGEGNLISGNNNTGIVLEITDDNQIMGNLIGTDISGRKVLGNMSSGIVINIYAKHNIIGGEEEDERNIISGNGGEGIYIGSSPNVTGNAIKGNFIGTDISGEEPLGNKIGILIARGAVNNTIGPNNKIAYNLENGILVAEPGTTGNHITQNSIYANHGSAIVNLDGGNLELPAPKIAGLDNRSITGQAAPHQVVEIFSDFGDEAEIYQGTAVADASGQFFFSLPRGSFQRTYVTANARDVQGNTSQLSSPEQVPGSGLTKELPNIVAPTQVSVEPAVIGTNLGLALFAVLFFGVTTTAFNDILKNYHEDISQWIRKCIPEFIRNRIKRTRKSALPDLSGWRLVLLWLFILVLTALIESFLDPNLRVFDVKRVNLSLTLFGASLVISGLEWVSDRLAHRALARAPTSRGGIQWLGLLFAISCVLVSRWFDFTPGYIYGILGTIYVLPKFTERENSGKRALIVQGAIFLGGLFFWICSALLPDCLAMFEPIFLTIFLISLQGVLFELVPLDFSDGGDLWAWKKGLWIICFALVFFFFFHFMVNPNAAEVQALQQNGVRLLGLIMAIYGLMTFVLWFICVLWKKKNQPGS